MTFNKIGAKVGAIQERLQGQSMSNIGDIYINISTAPTNNRMQN